MTRAPEWSPSLVVDLRDAAFAWDVDVTLRQQHRAINETLQLKYLQCAARQLALARLAN